MTNPTDFLSLDLGVAQEHPTKRQTVDITVDPSTVMAAYADKYAELLWRINSLKAEQVDLTAGELQTYFTFLVAKRVQCIHNVCRDFHQLQNLWIPSYVHTVLSQIGIFDIWEEGLHFVPHMEGYVDEPKEIPLGTFAEMMAISNKLALFEDELQLVQGAMPRDVNGSQDVMTTALIGDMVKSHVPLSHEAFSYITAFLDMKLVQETKFEQLYLRQHGYKDTIADILIADMRLK